MEDEEVYEAFITGQENKNINKTYIELKNEFNEIKGNRKMLRYNDKTFNNISMTNDILKSVIYESMNELIKENII